MSQAWHIVHRSERPCARATPMLERPRANLLHSWRYPSHSRMIVLLRVRLIVSCSLIVGHWPRCDQPRIGHPLASSWLRINADDTSGPLGCFVPGLITLFFKIPSNVVFCFIRTFSTDAPKCRRSLGFRRNRPRAEEVFKTDVTNSRTRIAPVVLVLLLETWRPYCTQVCNSESANEIFTVFWILSLLVGVFASSCSLPDLLQSCCPPS